MKLYFSNGSPFARKVRVVLAELGLDYETDILDGLRPTSSPPGPTARRTRRPSRPGPAAC